MKAPEGRQPGGGDDHDAARLGQERVLEVDEGQPGEQLLGAEDGVAPAGR